VPPLCGYAVAMPAAVPKLDRALLLGLTAARLAFGVALLALPGPVVRLFGGIPGRGSSTVSRLLGARHAVQALAQAGAGARALVPGAVVDALHAASMVLLARLAPRWRVAAEREAAVESGFIALGLALAAAFRRRGVRPASDPTDAPAIPA
jgi:hypothetical protein